MKKFFLYSMLLLVLGSCSEYQLVLKSKDKGVKYEYAMRMYAKKKYTKATGVFEELYTTTMRGTNAENVHYYFAKSYYGAGDYLLASFFFEDFCNRYPHSRYLEDAAYSNAMCYYKDSPENPLDQTSTHKAIAQM